VLDVPNEVPRTVRPTRPGRDLEGRHRALSSRTRTRLLELLRASGNGRDARTLAGELDLHVNTVRSHLAILEQADLVTSAPEERQVRGRPRILYSAVAFDDAGTGDEYRFLATVLASSLTTETAEPGRVAQQAGERWGQHLVERPRPGRRRRPSDAVDRALVVLDDLGFAPRLDAGEGTRIELHRCPFRELAAEHTDVVCGIHLGILRGALAEAGAAVDGISLAPFVTDTMCVATIDGS
jgi:predicted ArsR family transcriptional regulator